MWMEQRCLGWRRHTVVMLPLCRTKSYSQWKKPKKHNWNILFKWTLQQERFETFLYLLIWKTPLSRDLCIQCLQDRQFVFPAKQTHDLGVASTIHYQMIYWTSFCILFPYLGFALESHPVVSVSDENSVDIVICKILQESFSKFPKYASVMLRYF